MSDETITFLVLGVVVAVFIWDHVPVAAVALGIALTLWATGVLDLAAAFITPVATPANLRVMEPGGYRFSTTGSSGSRCSCCSASSPSSSSR